jgi:hypothetical protein
MYTGTLIRDLMITVERAEQSVQHRRMFDEQELERIFDLQISSTPGERLFVGAA